MTTMLGREQIESMQDRIRNHEIILEEIRCQLNWNSTVSFPKTEIVSYRQAELNHSRNRKCLCDAGMPERMNTKEAAEPRYDLCMCTRVLQKVYFKAKRYNPCMCTVFKKVYGGVYYENQFKTFRKFCTQINSLFISLSLQECLKSIYKSNVEENISVFLFGLANSFAEGDIFPWDLSTPQQEYNKKTL